MASRTALGPLLTSEEGAAFPRGRRLRRAWPARSGKGGRKHVESLALGHAPAHEAEEERRLVHVASLGLVAAVRPQARDRAPILAAPAFAPPQPEERALAPVVLVLLPLVQAQDAGEVPRHLV